MLKHMNTAQLDLRPFILYFVTFSELLHKNVKKARNRVLNHLTYTCLREKPRKRFDEPSVLKRDDSFLHTNLFLFDCA